MIGEIVDNLFTTTLFVEVKRMFYELELVLLQKMFLVSCFDAARDVVLEYNCKDGEAILHGLYGDIFVWDGRRHFFPDEALPMAA